MSQDTVFMDTNAPTIEIMQQVKQRGMALNQFRLRCPSLPDCGVMRSVHRHLQVRLSRCSTDRSATSPRHDTMLDRDTVSADRLGPLWLKENSGQLIESSPVFRACRPRAERGLSVLRNT